jgi:hypothetical protein
MSNLGQYPVKPGVTYHPNAGLSDRCGSLKANNNKFSRHSVIVSGTDVFIYTCQEVIVYWLAPLNHIPSTSQERLILGLFDGVGMLFGYTRCGGHGE